MTVIRSMAIWLLLACWLPASSHAILERFQLIHVVHDGHHHHPEPGAPDEDHGLPLDCHQVEDHAAADGECLLPPRESGPSAPACPRHAPDAFAKAVESPSDLLLRTGVDSGPAPPDTGPPRLHASWQFLQRAALPIRAPSVLS